MNIDLDPKTLQMMHKGLKKLHESLLEDIKKAKSLKEDKEICRELIECEDVLLRIDIILKG